MLRVENLTKYYGPIPGIVDMSFSAKKGEILGLLGPNGAGKTTAMKIITCFMPATSGTAKVAGFDVFKDSLEVRKRVGYLPETVPIYKDMVVTGYLEFVANIKGVEKKKRKEQIEKAMEECGVTEVSRRMTGHLSKGYQQRVGLAQALLGDPEVLILDEPTTGLDPKQIIEIRQLIKGLGRDRTIILCTHILPEVSMVCDRVIIINEGRMVAMDTPQNLSSMVEQVSRIRLEVEGPAEEVIDALSRVEGVFSARKEMEADGICSCMVEAEKGAPVRRALSSAIFQRGWGLLEMRPISITLEDVFVKLVTQEREVLGA